MGLNTRGVPLAAHAASISVICAAHGNVGRWSGAEAASALFISSCVADIAELLDDGLLDEDELFDLWAGAPKAPAPDAAAGRGAASGLTLAGFALVIAEIDALFELEEDDDEG